MSDAANLLPAALRWDGGTEGLYMLRQYFLNTKITRGVMQNALHGAPMADTLG